MGNLADDTAVTAVDDGVFTARLDPEWAIWGPAGGYIASIALRAAGAASPFPRPASFSCHFLGVAAFDEVDIAVRTLRGARTACSQRVEVTQGGKPILEATVWSVGEVDGLAHDVTEAPAVPGPDDVPTVQERIAALAPERLDEGPPFPFWNNLDSKPIEFWLEPLTEPVDPVWRGWYRFDPQATFDDPWVDACRSLVLVDVQSWPSAVRAHFGTEELARYVAPSLDLYVSFNDPQPASAWLLTDGHGPLARDGLMAWTGRLWSEGGRLVASGGGQMLCRRVPSG